MHVAAILAPIEAFEMCDPAGFGDGVAIDSCNAAPNSFFGVTAGRVSVLEWAAMVECLLPLLLCPHPDT